MSSVAHPATHIYRDTALITFNSDPTRGLSVEIKTARLFLRSVRKEDTNDYALLYCDSHVMGKFADGTPKTRDLVEKRIDGWVERWKQGNNPYSGFAIFKSDTGEFVGHVIAGHGDQPGESEAAALLERRHWRKGYTREIANALIEYLLATLKQGYLIEGKPLEKVVFTARPDNPGTIAIAQKHDMQLTRTEEKWGAPRHHYCISIEALLTRDLAKRIIAVATYLTLGSRIVLQQG
jgi:RimJ/RimL family protein N-acetyltransferase